MTHEFILRVELLSDAGPGTGEGRASAIDREVPHDQFGLPILPGRRLKGLWRESVLEVEECGLVPLGLTRTLFGTGMSSGLIRVANGDLKDAHILRPWVAWCRERAPLDFGVERVLASFTYLRQQTAMSRSTGAPMDNTLRRIRVLKRGLVFEAIATLRSDDHGYITALALAAAGLRRLGVARNRGFGRVGCAVFDGDTDVTKGELARLREAVA